MVDYVGYWAGRAEVPKRRLIELIGIGRSTFYSWKERYGVTNDHNSPVPRWFWLTDGEREAIAAYQAEHPLEGYRRLAYMMLDADVVAASPSTVYRVLRRRGQIGQKSREPSRKGEGFDQPTGAHQHWHMDVSYVNICGTFYYLCGVLDGFSRYVVHWEIREHMKARDVEIVLQRAREKHPEARPRIISDNGPQFVAKDFKEFIRQCGMTHVRTAPFYPQSNGKYERWNRSVKAECIRPKTPLSLEDARRVLADFIDHYNGARLHGGIGYIAPVDKLEGRAEQIVAERNRKLEAARRRRRESYRQRGSLAAPQQLLTSDRQASKREVAGETDASSAGKHLARDNRPGHATGCRSGAGEEACPQPSTESSVDAPYALKNPGSPQASHPLKSEEHLSKSR